MKLLHTRSEPEAERLLVVLAENPTSLPPEVTP